MHAVHIKSRNSCTPKEKMDYKIKNIANILYRIHTRIMSLNKVQISSDKRIADEEMS